MDGAEENKVPDAVESNVRWCFKTPDLKLFHTTLLENGQHVTDIYSGPYGHDYFDFWVTEGVSPNRRRRSGCGQQRVNEWVRIGVQVIHKAKEWYSRYTGMSVLSEYPEEGYVVMGMRSNGQTDDIVPARWVLEHLAAGSYSITRKDERTRPFAYVFKKLFLEYHKFLSEQGIPTVMFKEIRIL